MAVRPRLRRNWRFLSVGGAIVLGVPSDAISVRLVEWNVAMSLQSKAHLIARLKPTIAILPESAHPDLTGQVLEAIGATSVQWIGSNRNKGLLAVAFGGWRLRIDASYDPGYQWVMPLHLSGPRQIRLLAVWDMNHRGSGHLAARRIGACRASIEHYDGFLSGDSDLTVLSGDFNNSVYWDKPTKRAKFGDFMDELESRGFLSAYHSHHGCERGAEPHPTLWWMKNIDTTYHIDYTFVSHPGAVEAVTMGPHADWIAHSDHSPMTVDLRVVSHHEMCAGAVTVEKDEAPGKDVVTDSGHQPPDDPISTKETSGMRFPIEPGSVPDMICGVNGEKFMQEFRPTYLTAGWVNGVLVEVTVWGPRVLQNGSLGKRELDHRWKKTLAAGGVRLADLPPWVASQLRVYNTERESRVLPEQL